MLRRNLPGWERAIRIGAGLCLAVGGWQWAGGGTLGALLVASGAGLAATGLLAWCPACAVAGRAPAGPG